MVTGQNRVFGCAANLLRGKKCVFCGSFKVNRTRRGYVKCRKCGKRKSLAKLRHEIAIIQGFYQQDPAYRLTHDLAVDAKVISRSIKSCVRPSSMWLNWKRRKASCPVRSNWTKLISVGDGKAGAAEGLPGKRVVFGLLERDGRVYTKVLENVSVETIMTHIHANTRKGSVYYTD